jgi:protease IV
MIWPFRPKTSKQIARLEVSGPISSETRKRVLKALDFVEQRKFPVLLLRIDSPGGTVGDSQEIYSALMRLREKTKIIASFGNISASGGIYIAMGAEHIVANPGTITGSIGVILRGNNLERLLEKIGVSFKVIKSGPYKDILSFDRQLTPEEEGILQQLIDSTYNQFVQTVSHSRNIPVETVKGFADGRIFTGEQALSLGVVDSLGTEEDARILAAKLVGLDPNKTKCYNIEEPKPFLKKLLPLRGGSLELLTFELMTSGQPLWFYSC